MIGPKLARAVEAAVARGLSTQALSLLRGLVREGDAVAKASRSAGRARGGGQSSKAKGRDACLTVKALLHETFPVLAEDDVLVKATSMAGTDLHLSPRAAALFAYGIEVKNVEALNVWGALKQADINADKKGLPGVLFFTRARAPMYVGVAADVFLRVVKRGLQGCDQGAPEADGARLRDGVGSGGAVDGLDRR